MTEHTLLSLISPVILQENVYLDIKIVSLMTMSIGIANYNLITFS